MEKIIPRTFYQRDTAQVARDLLGKKVIRYENGNYCSGIIVETEAYECTEEACHAFRGKTKSNEALFGQVGHAYIYFIYGMYYCLNVVAKNQSIVAGGVLIRALEPVDGIELMKQRRSVKQMHQLTNGPGKLTQAFNITKKLYGIDVTLKGPLYITEGIEIPQTCIVEDKRIGISKEQERAWRFYCKDNSFVSKW